MSSQPQSEGTTLSLDQALALAQSHHVAGRLHDAEAIYRSVLQAVPGHPLALYLLGAMAVQLDRYEVAEQHFREVLRQRPQAFDAWIGLASALHELGRLAEAEDAARSAIRIDGRKAAGHAALGSVLLARSRHAAATTSLAHAVSLDPRDPALMTSLLYCMTQDEAVDADELARMHRLFGKRFGSGAREREPHANLRDPGKRLRVGFVSGDLRQHAVAYFVEPVWHALDRSQVELFAYSNLRWEDATSQRLKAAVDGWRAVLSLDDDQLARQVRDDAIDILIDLSGHTVRNRLLMFARKPAPVQVSWIGYPETTGLAAIDYKLADRWSAPPGPIDAQFVEKLVRLPASAAFGADPNAPPVGPLPALGSGHVTFGSFNRLSKLGAAVIPAWSRILTQVAGSRLVIANVSDAAQEEDLRARFAEQGVAAERLRFVPRLPLADYLALHHEVDLLLDTFPYTGGTTTQHALWMGVPVVTLAGARRTQRISTANLARVGLHDWAVESVDGYVARAVAAAADLPGLAALRAGLRERVAASPLRRPETVARSLEIAWRRMWTDWCEGLPPQAFEVGLEQVLPGAGA